ncbi:hypothetical protein [Numidum massiliense]|uniref:hypothetical protein n=1 Tax=Numidum massiliense TaxID=1522315 RepID=UPI00164ED96C|nr:hypothetical protein [Numidum massiliense]
MIAVKLLIAARDATERVGVEWLVSAYRLAFTAIEQASDWPTLLIAIERVQP